MSDTTTSLRRKIASAGELQAVVRTMKALAASSIGQYEASVRALADYARTVELGLSVCMRRPVPGARAAAPRDQPGSGRLRAVVFGSDQGLVGRFNEVVVDHALDTLAGRVARTDVWAVGDRVRGYLTDAGLAPAECFTVPGSVRAITPLVGQVLLAAEAHRPPEEPTELYLFYNRRTPDTVYGPVALRLLPLDAQWRRRLARLPWPTANLPDVAGGADTTLRALVGEYLFVSVFRACAESLASENASRLAAMQRAERNIDELLEELTGTYHRVRQSTLDEELFDVRSGFDTFARLTLDRHGGRAGT